MDTQARTPSSFHMHCMEILHVLLAPCILGSTYTAPAIALYSPFSCGVELSLANLSFPTDMMHSPTARPTKLHPIFTKLILKRFPGYWAASQKPCWHHGCLTPYDQSKTTHPCGLQRNLQGCNALLTSLLSKMTSLTVTGNKANKHRTSHCRSRHGV